MKLNLSNNPVLVVAVVAALAAGTVLVAGYVDRTDASAADVKCAACPAKDTDACCKNKTDSPCGTGACTSDSGGCCQDGAAAAGCAGGGCSVEGGAAGEQTGTVTGCGGESTGCCPDKAAGDCCPDGGAASEQTGTVTGCGGGQKAGCGGGGCTLTK
jgi:hypothetical protein